MIELNKIYNEDCLEGMKRIPDKSVDLIVTDPPYMMNYQSGWRKKENRFDKIRILSIINLDKLLDRCYNNNS